MHLLNIDNRSYLYRDGIFWYSGFLHFLESDPSLNLARVGNLPHLRAPLSSIHRAKPMIFLLWIIVCASSAPLQEAFRNCQCFLSCEGASELKKHDRVRVFVQHLVDDEKIHNVSSLYNGGRCSVPGCFQKGIHYRMQIYAYNEEVPKILFNEADLQPECEPEGISGKNPNSADGIHSKMFLILLIFCFRIVFHL